MGIMSPDRMKESAAAINELWFQNDVINLATE